MNRRVHCLYITCFSFSLRSFTWNFGDTRFHSLWKKNYGRHEMKIIIKQPYNTIFSFAYTIINEYMCYASLLYDTKINHLAKIVRKRKIAMLVWVFHIRNQLLVLFSWVFV